MNTHAEMSFADAEAMGLSHDEWLLILKRLDRTPNLCELGIFFSYVVRTLFLQIL